MSFSFVPSCIIICSGAFHKLSLIWSKISIIDAPGYFLILVHASLINTVYHMASNDFDIWLFFWLSSANLILGFFTSLAIWFYWRTVLFNCCDLFFYCIYTDILLWIIYTLDVGRCNLVELWVSEALFVFSSQSIFQWISHFI